MIFIGIDPGKTGAIVALDSDGRVLLAELCPTYLKEFDDTAMALLVAKLSGLGGSDPELIVAGIEKGQTRPGESLRGAFSFGEGIGIWRGVLAANLIGWRWIMPQAWQQRALAGEKKPKSRKELKGAVTRSALRRWPGLHELLKLKKNQGVADAAWIADHVRYTHAHPRT